MKTAHRFQNDLSSTASPDFTSALKIVLLYEDFEMGVHGKSVFDLMTRKAGTENDAKLAIWRLDFLNSPDLIDTVSRQAEDADVIIMALRGPNVPLQIEAWLDQFSEHRHPGRALIAVLPPATDLHSSSACLRLSMAAERAGMDFFCRVDGGSLTGSVKGKIPTTLTKTLVPHASPSAYYGWGIND